VLGLQAGGENYILPTDALISAAADIQDQGFPLAQMLEVMESSVGTRILLIDACRNNPFGTSHSNTRSLSRGGLQPMQARTGTFIGYSTAPNSEADDGNGANSPFAMAVAQHLGTKGLQLDDWFREVRRSVVQLTSGRQVPWSASSMLETFYFSPAAVSTDQVIAALPPKSDIKIDDSIRALISDSDTLINGRKVETLAI